MLHFFSELLSELLLFIITCDYKSLHFFFSELLYCTSFLNFVGSACLPARPPARPTERDGAGGTRVCVFHRGMKTGPPRPTRTPGRAPGMPSRGQPRTGRPPVTVARNCPSMPTRLSWARFSFVFFFFVLFFLFFFLLARTLQRLLTSHIIGRSCD